MADLYSAFRLFAQMAPAPLVIKQATRIPDWPSLDAQDQLFHMMFGDELLRKWPLDSAYVADVVARFADHLSTCDDGLHDLLAAQLCSSAGKCEPDAPCYSTYWLSACSDPYVVQVARRMDKLALRVWPATFELIGFCMNHVDLLRGKVVLELGSGFAIACACHPETILLTEMAGEPVANLQRCCDVCTSPLPVVNQWHYCSTLCGCVSVTSAVDKETHGGCGRDVRGLVLDWCAPQAFEWAKKDLSDAMACAADVDIIVGSDIVYDPSLTPLLLNTVAFFVNSRQATTSVPCEAYFACTVRTEATFEEFRRCAVGHGLAFDVLSLRSYGDTDEVATAPSCTSLFYTLADSVAVRPAARGKQDVAVVKLSKK